MFLELLYLVAQDNGQKSDLRYAHVNLENYKEASEVTPDLHGCNCDQILPMSTQLIETRNVSLGFCLIEKETGTQCYSLYNAVGSILASSLL